MYRVNVKKMQRLARRAVERESAKAVVPPPREEPLPDRFRLDDGTPSAQPCKQCGRPFATRSGMSDHEAAYHGTP